ncbi:Lrp/AsnC family transcriptional regulator [Celeribacter indicus]|uniref:AsnC family transcriptional regulator n=1 Tax=Celeribacter indicus TaxID=1208324 RepID=A0A0B5DQP9_9RHOB|nr:Lrp/AsnC family transcriptional regulator [Celeribacter indicus]AJE45853.1 AsnC family transcriptional regulator [Celeribacter indicus]SDW62295.1 transcriptional regulator, AsnC family [Celeribacter indicus]
MSTLTLDRIDRKILHELMHDATLPVAQLAERVGLSQTPCWKRVQKLEAAGIITRRVALVDPEKIGIGLMVFVEIEATDHSPEWRAEFRRVVPRFTEIVEVYRMAGDIDYLLKVAVSDMSAFDEFYLELTRALPCRNITSKFVMETVQTTTALPIDVATA